MTKISAIVPVYNLEKKGLDKCLDSLVNQTFKDIEIIVVNDGSTDNSQKIIDNYKQKYQNITSFTIKNSGQAVARNFGLSKAKGEYISFIDGDDYIELDTYEKLNEYIKMDKDIILFDYKLIYSNRSEYMKSYNPIDKSNVTVKEYLLSHVVSPCNKILKKSYLEQINFKFPEHIIYEDYASMPTLAINNPKIAYIDKALYNYVQSENSTTRNQIYKKKYEDLFEATDYLYSMLKNTSFLEELEYIICYHNLFLGSYNFYRFQKYDMIDKESDSIKEKFPNWKKNKYIKKLPPKVKILMNLFYKKKYNLIVKIQKLKFKIMKGTKYEK